MSISPPDTSLFAAPLASKSTESLVLMCPSTWMQLKVSATTLASSDCATSGAIAASVMTIPSMVAIRGPIIAAPFARPVIVMSLLDPVGTRQLANFGTVSVVIMPRAAARSACSSLFSWPAASAMPLPITSMGKKTPMIPVDMTSTCSAARPQLSARS